jgi:hypothetical protein
VLKASPMPLSQSCTTWKCNGKGIPCSNKAKPYFPG